MEPEQLTAGERQRIREILEDDTFRKVAESILNKMDGPIFDMKAPEQLTALAVTKGGRDFLRLMKKASSDPRVKQEMPNPKTIHNRS